MNNRVAPRLDSGVMSDFTAPTDSRMEGPPPIGFEMHSYGGMYHW